MRNVCDGGEAILEALRRLGVDYIMNVCAGTSGGRLRADGNPNLLMGALIAGRR
jgi:hypothetical protein